MSIARAVSADGDSTASGGRSLVLLGWLLAVAACNAPRVAEHSATPEREPHARLSFDTLGINYSTQCGHATAAEFVIRDAEHWAALWDVVQATAMAPSPPPRVDFEAHVVLAVFQGTCPSGGYGVRIDEVVEEAQGIRVIVHKWTPAPDVLTTQALTSPAHIVKVPRRDKDICFEIWMLEHAARSHHRLQDGTVDPDVYKEVQYSDDGRALVVIHLNEPCAEELLGELSSAQFEPGFGYAQGASVYGRISLAGITELQHDPRVKGILFEGPFSKPDEYVLERACHAAAGEADANPLEAPGS